MGNLQLRYLKYDFEQDKIGLLPGHKYDIDWLFLSPRLGLTYKINEDANIYWSFAVASREPSDVSIYDAEEISAFPNLEIEQINVSATDDTTYTFGDPTIDPERVYNFFAEGGIEDLRLEELFLEKPLGEGDVDFPAYVRALDEIGYTGFYTIEREVGEDPEADIRKAVQFLKQLLEKESV